MPKTFAPLINASYQRYLESFQAAHHDPGWLSKRLASFPK